MSSFIKKYERGQKQGRTLEYAYGVTPQKFRREGKDGWRVNNEIEVFSNDAIEVYGEVNGEDFGVYIGVNRRKHKFDDR